ncbi:MAG TPA: YceI family protein [Ilumatobacteraceae bacterium]|nr:YceI family protein [Ilumatobacteraceae bacterium]
MSLDQLTPGTWTIDAPHSTIGFVARHMMLSKVRGRFTDFTASIEVADPPQNSTVFAEVQMASVTTGEEGRDSHLRTNDFFDVENHPTMTLRSTGFEADGDDYVMHADLTIKGTTLPVDFELEFAGVGQDPWGGTRAGFTASTTINRRDFGVEWNAPLETGGVLVGDKVAVELDVQLVKA